MRYPHCIADALTMGGTLGKKERRKRALFLSINVATFVCGLFYFLYSLKLGVLEPVLVAVYVLVLTASLIGIVIVLLRQHLTTTVVCAVVAFYVLGLLLGDLYFRAFGRLMWPILVLTVDYLLVMQVPTRYSAGLVCLTCCWLLLMFLEGEFRFGLFDLPGTSPQSGEHGRREYYEKQLDCETLPCAAGQSGTFGVAISVFIIDFVATRGFARDILKEQATMQRTINVVQEIASLLAKYDVEGVAEMLKVQRDELPEEMHATLQRMEENLRKYRPYLPAALFEEEGGAPSASVPPPVLVNDVGTIVFTDIRSSTSIWECAPEGMRAGLKIHNAVLREVMQVFGGYEVKTIGDAFMVAFATTADGVHFGLKVQERLREANWPASLLEEAPICAEQGPLWGGLTVRIGVNSGPVTVEQCSLTGRTDYFGHTVNVASRLESTCTPGAVAVPCDLWTSACGSCSAFVGEAESLSLKGVSEMLFVRCVWPVSLGKRKRNPLRELAYSDKKFFGARSLRHSAAPSASSLGSDTSVRGAPTLRFLESATVGIIALNVGEERGSALPLATVSSSLSTLTVALDQSGGMLVTLLGSSVCVGWNLARSAPSHMENAIRFAQRILATTTLRGAGLVSGPVQHGDVGARQQRFVTVMGRTVRRSWVLCEEAMAGDGGVCLFEPPEGTVLPSSLDHVLVEQQGGPCTVYKVNLVED